MKEIKLPVLEEEALLPTGKQHVSYSELSDWMDCSFRHKLKYVDKIDLDSASIHTVFGSCLHDALKEYVLTKKMPDFEEYEKKFVTEMTELVEKGLATQKDVEEFRSQIVPILEQIPQWLDETFPGWETVNAELELYESIKPGRWFRGFIDAIIKVPVQKKKNGVKTPTDDHVYYILDWKTCSWGWRPQQKQSFQKQLQLMLYKTFWCALTNTEPKDVRCGFVLLKRTPSKENKRLELVKVSVGPKTKNKTLNELHNMVNQVNRGVFLKNRNACRFCVYLNTPHCL